MSAADLAICHHEIPYGRPGGPYTGYPTFKAPHQLADALKDAGYDSCSTGSNHTLDDGYDGLARTLEHLDRVGIPHVGSARSPEEAKAPALLGRMARRSPSWTTRTARTASRSPRASRGP